MLSDSERKKHKTRKLSLPKLTMAPEIKDNARLIDSPHGDLQISPNGSFDIPDGYGLFIQLAATSERVFLETEPDCHFPKIHPNCYAPEALRDLYLLKGGGSGTAVFHGWHPKLGSIVMKHGGAKDTREVFSLAEIRRELEARGGTEETIDVAGVSADAMRRRIPEFVGVYISKHHVRNRARELWSTLRETSLHNLLSLNTVADEEMDLDDSLNEHDRRKRRDSITERLDAVKEKREFRVCRGEDTGFEVLFRRVLLHIPAFDADGVITDGLHFLYELADQLATEQERQYWKVTLCQKTIGGTNAENGASVLTRGGLMGSLQQKLIQEFSQVMQDLQNLTLPNERSGVEAVRVEVDSLRVSRDILTVSKMADSFCGSAILKNFKPNGGRFFKLREMGSLFRNSKELLLAPGEAKPAKYLGMILERGSKLSCVFHEVFAVHSALDAMEGSWLDVLEHATSLTQKSATDRIWTCGLTDAGLHNTFLSEERGLELFDLGEPQLVPQPAFLTKFLMSFFHTLGMQEGDDGKWVRRFVVASGKLSLTEDTRALLPYIYKAFEENMDHFIYNIFGGDENVRSLLHKYVVLQLLSDAAFCLARWERKGGGKERIRNTGSLHKWLWRSLWDIYIASDVHHRLILKANIHK